MCFLLYLFIGISAIHCDDPVDQTFIFSETGTDSETCGTTEDPCKTLLSVVPRIDVNAPCTFKLLEGNYIESSLTLESCRLEVLPDQNVFVILVHNQQSTDPLFVSNAAIIKISHITFNATVTSTVQPLLFELKENSEFTLTNVQINSMCTEDSQIKEAYSLIHATKATVTLSFLTVIDLTTILKITSTKEADICGWTVGFISLEECTTTIEDSKFENVSFGAVFMSKGKASLHNVTFGSETISSNFSGYMRNVRCVQSGEIEADGITVTNANGDEMFGHYIDAVGCRAQGEEFKGETAPFFRPILKNVTITQPESMNDYFYLTFDTTGLYPCYTRFETETGYHPPMPSSIRNRPNIYNNYDFETYVNTSRAEGRIRKAAIPDDNRTIAFELIYKRHGGVTEYSNSLSVDAPAPPSPVNPDDPENPLPHEDEDPGKEKLSSVWIGVIVGGSFLVVIAVLMIVGFILRKIYGPINLKKDGAGVEKLGGSTGNKDAAGATGVSQSEATKNVKYVTGPPEIELKAMGASNQNPQELTAPQRQLTQVYDDQFDKTDLSRNYEIDCPPVLSLPPQESIALPVVYNPITDDEKITDDITQD